MISATTRFIKKHQKKFFITLGITGGAYFIGKWATWKFIEMQERNAAERTAKENMKKRFHQRQNDCTFTVLSHIPTLVQQLMDDFDVESIFGKLQKAKHSGNNATTSTAPKNTSDLANNDNNEHTTSTTPTSSVVLVENNNNEPVSTTPTSSVVLVDRPNESDGETAKVTETTTYNQGENSSENNTDSTSQESEANSPLRSPVNTSEDKVSKQLRLELWTEVKFKSFIRTTAAVYLETFLTLILFLQLNLLGRYNYLYSVSLTERDREQMITLQSTGSLLNSVTEQKYLTFIGWFLNVGYREIVARVRAAVESSLSSMSFKHELSYQDFVWLISEIRSKIEGTDHDGSSSPPTHKFFNVMMPENLSDEIRVLNEYGGNMFDSDIDSDLRKLLDETKDFIHSPDFATVISACLDSAFNLLYQDMLPHFYHNDQLSDERVEKNVTLAKLLPHITKEAHIILNGVPNRFLDAIRDCKELQATSAIIYASFDNVDYKQTES